MGFNKRFVNPEVCMEYLKQGRLKEYYGKSDVLIFNDNISTFIYELYNDGLEHSEIITILNKKLEEHHNEMYQSNQEEQGC